MNEGMVRVFDSWMPFILIMLIFVACIVSLVISGTIHIALQGIVVGMIFIMGLHYVPNKKKKFIMDK